LTESEAVEDCGGEKEKWVPEQKDTGIERM
jgi:hypothetical protein